MTKRYFTQRFIIRLTPRVFSDFDGKYPQFAGGKTIETAKGFTYYEDYNLWDTYRAVHPLHTILEPKRTADMMQSLIVKAEQGGWLPIFPCWNQYGCHDRRPCDFSYWRCVYQRY
jgi:putative alpha-1,2-mannosidase